MKLTYFQSLHNLWDARALPGGIARSLPLRDAPSPPLRRHYRIIYSSLSPLNHPVVPGEGIVPWKDIPSPPLPENLPLPLFNRGIIKIIPVLPRYARWLLNKDIVPWNKFLSVKRYIPSPARTERARHPLYHSPPSPFSPVETRGRGRTRTKDTRRRQEEGRDRRLSATGLQRAARTLRSKRFSSHHEGDRRRWQGRWQAEGERKGSRGRANETVVEGDRKGGVVCYWL